MRLVPYSLLGTILAAAFYSPANAQSACAPREHLLETAQKRHGEVPHFRALSRSGALIEILLNIETGSWGVILTAPGGPTCVVDFGSNWTHLDVAKPLVGDPT